MGARMKIDGHAIELSNRDKLFFPEAGLPKGAIVAYYERIADTMLPHLRRYAVSMQRFPDGIRGESFYNKDTPDHFPSWIRRVDFPRRKGGRFKAPVVDSKAALVYLADQGVLTHHLYLARTDDLEHPDRMIYDLDPPESATRAALARQAALDMRDILGELDLPAWVQTTGSKGFHVVVPLDRQADFEAVRAFAEDTALLLARRQPERYTVEQRTSKRKGRVFLDTLRNAYGATAVAPYAVRGLPGAPVATPLDWHEVERGASPRHWTVTTMFKRLAQKEDPWAHLMRHACSLSRRRRRLEDLLDRENPLPGVKEDGAD